MTEPNALLAAARELRSTIDANAAKAGSEPVPVEGAGPGHILDLVEGRLRRTADDAERVADRLEKLRSRIAGTTLHALGTHAELSVTVSVGIAQMPEDGREVREVLACADARLYEAKRAGRNRIV